MTFTAGATGGEYKHTLTINEMPSHKHDLITTIATSWTNAGGSSVQGSNQTGLNPFNFNWVKDTGEGAAHNNTQPYTVVYRWHRVS